MRCQRCQNARFIKTGFDRAARQILRCTCCAHRQTDRSTSAFRGYRFPDTIIALAVRWYLRYRLPYADLAELLAERGIYVDPSTLFDWVQHFTPLYKDAARHHRHRVTGRWSADETYVRIAGHWCYVFRAIDEEGQVIDVYVSPTRDVAAAIAFLTRAMASTGVTPYAITTDRAPIYPPAFARVLPNIEHRTGKMIQQRIERDHEHLKGRYRCMRGFQTVPCAQVICAGHGVMRNLRDGFYWLGVPSGDPRLRQAPRLVQAWDDVTRILIAG
jgi:transposase, IS6 family